MKPIKLFEQFVNESVTKQDFDKVVAVVKKANQPATVMFVPKWGEIEIIIGDAPDNVSYAISNEIDKLDRDLRKKVSIAAESSSYSRREYDSIEKIKGGH